MKNMDLEKYLGKFEFRPPAAGLKERIIARLESQCKEHILWIDRLWNLKYAFSVVALVVFFIIFNLYTNRYLGTMNQVVSQEKETLDFDIETICAYLDESQKVSLLDYLKYIREKKEEKTFKDYREYILEIRKLIG